MAKIRDWAKEHARRKWTWAGHVAPSQLLMLAIVLARPLLIHADAEVFNLRGALLGPGPQLAARLYRPLDSLSVGYATFFACRAAKERSKLSEQLRASARIGAASNGDGTVGETTVPVETRSPSSDQSDDRPGLIEC